MLYYEEVTVKQINSNKMLNDDSMIFLMALLKKIH